MRRINKRLIAIMTIMVLAVTTIGSALASEPNVDLLNGNNSGSDNVCEGTTNFDLGSAETFGASGGPTHVEFTNWDPNIAVDDYEVIVPPGVRENTYGLQGRVFEYGTDCTQDEIYNGHVVRHMNERSAKEGKSLEYVDYASNPWVQTLFAPVGIPVTPPQEGYQPPADPGQPEGGDEFSEDSGYDDVAAPVDDLSNQAPPADDYGSVDEFSDGSVSSGDFASLSREEQCADDNAQRLAEYLGVPLSNRDYCNYQYAGQGECFNHLTYPVMRLPEFTTAGAFVVPRIEFANGQTVVAIIPHARVNTPWGDNAKNPPGGKVREWGIYCTYDEVVRRTLDEMSSLGIPESALINWWEIPGMDYSYLDTYQGRYRGGAKDPRTNQACTLEGEQRILENVKRLTRKGVYFTVSPWVPGVHDEIQTYLLPLPDEGEWMYVVAPEAQGAVNTWPADKCKPGEIQADSRQRHRDRGPAHSERVVQGDYRQDPATARLFKLVRVR